MILRLIATVTQGVDMTQLGNFISSIGFPIFVAVWLLYKSHKDTATMQTAINSLENAILELNTYIRALHDDKNVRV